MVRTLKAIDRLGFVFEAGRLAFGMGGPDQREVYRISKVVGEELLTLDLLMVDPSYTAIWKKRKVVTWRGHRLKMIGLEGLLEMKRIAGRPKDRLDIEMLTNGRETYDG